MLLFFTSALAFGYFSCIDVVIGVQTYNNGR